MRPSLNVSASPLLHSRAELTSLPFTTAEPIQRKGKGKGKAQNDNEDDDEGRKNTDSQFASHLKAAGPGASTFSRNKTLKQQRQYLPAFASREALLNIIRENQGGFDSLSLPPSAG